MSENNSFFIKRPSGLSQEEFDLLSAELAMSRKKEEEEKLQICFDSAYKKFIALLDDPEKVTAYNLHVQHLLSEHPGLINYYLMTLEKTEAFKAYEIKKAIGQDKKKDNAYCEMDFIGKEVTDVAVTFGTNHLAEKNYTEAIKTILHEFNHVYHGKQQRQLRAYIQQTMKSPQKHIEELCCDAVTDIAIPWPRYGDMRCNESQKKHIARQEKFNAELSTVNEKYSWATADELEMIRQITKEYLVPYTVSDEDSPTHPADKRFLDNSNRITDMLAQSRVNDYLDRIYDGYVPDYKTLQWQEVVEETRPGVEQDNLAEPVPAMVPVGKTKKRMRQFLDTGGKICDKVGSFLDSFVPQALKDDPLSEQFKWNGLCMTSMPLMVGAAMLYENQAVDMRQAVVGLAVNLVGQVFFEGRNEILKKKYQEKVERQAQNNLLSLDI